MGTDNAAHGIYDLAVRVGAKTALKDVGMRVEDLDAAAELATHKRHYNPKPVTRKGVRLLLENAYLGRRPG